MAERRRVAIAISGRGSNMAALLYASRAADCPYEIVLVAANDPEAPGLKLAEAEGIPVWAKSHRALSRSEFDAALDEAVREAGAEFVALAGYMRRLSASFVEGWKGRIVNIHPSLLPKYKGLDTHERALAAGDRVTGCTVHIVTAELDSGAILAQTEVAILDGDTPEALAARVLIAEHQLYPRTLATYIARESDPDWLIERVGERALALPETSFRLSHGAPGWRVGSKSSGKFFAYVSVRHHGEDAIALLVKTSGQDEMNALIEAEPDLYYRPAYYGPSGWIAMRLDRPGTDWDHVTDWLRRSWRRAAPKRLTKLMDAAAEF